MMKTLLNFFTWIGILATILLVTYMLTIFTADTSKQIDSIAPTQKLIDNSLKNLQFDLTDPEEAPEAIRKQVETGYRLVINTHKLLPEYAGDRLDCSSCHFAGGITTGGVNGGISLAGVAAKYPHYNPATKSIEDLQIRVNKCFQDSMNGKPLPVDSKEMQAITAYLTWISKKYPIYGNAPWLGIKPLKSKHQPDAIQGKKLYAEFCMDCHGANGDGGNRAPGHAGKSIPPIFGKNSYNTSAGMHNLETFASFIYHNMPLDDPHLEAIEALDIAAYVHEQPRPTKD